MRPRLYQLPRAALVLAFAIADDRGLTRVAREVCGIFVQRVVRWPRRQVLWDPAGGVLCWSAPSSRRHVGSALAGMAMVIVATLALEAPGTALLSGLVWFGIRLGHLPVHAGFAEVIVCVALARSLGALRTASEVWRTDRRRVVQSPGAVWRLDLIGAFPGGRGTGTELLGRFLILADAAGVDVSLVCEPERVAYYYSHGFTRRADSQSGLSTLIRHPHRSRLAA